MISQQLELSMNIMPSNHRSLSSVQTITLNEPPCCLEFSPIHPHCFVVGTYLLHQPGVVGQSSDEFPECHVAPEVLRTGSLKVFYVDVTKEEASLVQTSFQPAAILDLHFSQCRNLDGSAIMVAVTSVGTITIHHLDLLTRPGAPLVDVTSYDLAGPEDRFLILSCTWHPSNPSILGITTSTGNSMLVTVDFENSSIMGVHKLPLETHLENWIMAITPTVTVTNDSKAFSVLTGGDDSVLRWTSCVYTSDPKNNKGDQGLTMEETFGEQELSNRHMAGITAIHTLNMTMPNGWSLIVTGSYDDTIRLFAWRPLHESFGARNIRLLTELNLGGGVWRIKDIESFTHDGCTSFIFLVSCMYAGTRIVQLQGSDDEASWQFVVLAKFEEHKSMNYASEVVPLSARQTPVSGMKEKMVISTSFYDKLICLWWAPSSTQ